MIDELERIKKLYELTVNTASSTPPKRGMFSSKCPTCGAKLKKESVVHPLFAEEGAEDFANKVVHDNGESPGLYSLTINHFTCSCGYVFAERRLDQVDPES
jgi:hypothetical protein